MRTIVTIFFSMILLNGLSQEKTIRIKKTKIEDGTYLSDVFLYSYKTTKGKEKNVKVQLKCIVANDSLFIFQDEHKLLLANFQSDTLAYGLFSNPCNCSDVSENMAFKNDINSNQEKQLVIANVPFRYRSSELIIKPKKFNLYVESKCNFDTSKFYFTKISD